MTQFLSRSSDYRRAVYEEAARRLGLSAGSVEKDFWICWTLRAMFGLPASGPHLTFKGGTSLSKGWNLIERFSEDVDLVIDRAWLGFGGAEAPEGAPSLKQRAKRLDALRVAAQRHIRTVLHPELMAQMQAHLGAQSSWALESDPDDPDAQTLLFHYPSVVGATAYVRSVVKIELGARSDTEPAAATSIGPYLAEVFPDEVPEASVVVRTVAPERTFWEKVALLHEESYRDASVMPRARLARHYYDLWCLIRRGVGARAASDRALFNRVAWHRAVFFRRNRTAQRSFAPGTLRIVPVGDARVRWQRDYDAMRDSMFFGPVPEFTEVMAVVGVFEDQFNRG